MTALLRRSILLALLALLAACGRKGPLERPPDDDEAEDKGMEGQS